MEGYLNDSQIKHVLFHLNHVLELNDDIRSRMVFLPTGEKSRLSEFTNKIIFLLSERPLHVNAIKSIQDIPLLFPLSPDRNYCTHDSNGNLVFTDDLLKSSFYLLSGYQEYKSPFKDHLGRFPYESSIQKSLNIIHKPVVNYYFEFIINSVRKFCERHSLTCRCRKIFNPFGFHLSHDIDKLDFYTQYYIAYKIKQILGIRKRSNSFLSEIKLLAKGIIQYLNFINRQNPAWDFDYLIETERKYHMPSTFFFLDKDVLHSDAYYRLNEPRVIRLIQRLHHEGKEIGLHGTVDSGFDEGKMADLLRGLNTVSPTPIKGIRQHRLLMDFPETIKIQERVGLQYDSSLGFAAHEGFRNSYCLPFKPYDFENDRTIDVWELPLNVMDVTLFEYRKLDYTQALKSLESILDEVARFNGVFTLLWHNGYFDEAAGQPGLTNFYETLLEKVASRDPEKKSGREVIQVIS
jgi:peptidoglycan/xylan/chitin deacetylase (PgdA/CDA1 family)